MVHIHTCCFLGCTHSPCGFVDEIRCSSSTNTTGGKRQGWRQSNKEEETSAVSVLDHRPLFVYYCLRGVPRGRLMYRIFEGSDGYVRVNNTHEPHRLLHEPCNPTVRPKKGAALWPDKPVLAFPRAQRRPRNLSKLGSSRIHISVSP